MIFKHRYASFVLSLLLAAAGSAHADPAQDKLAAAIAEVTPFSCVTESNVIINRQMSLMIPRAFLEGVATHLQKDASFAKGDKTYDQLYAVIREAVALDEASNGPYIDITMPRVLASLVARWGPEDQAYYTKFFASVPGKLYLTHIVDGALCMGLLQGVAEKPYPPLAGEDKVRWEALVKEKEVQKANFTATLRALSPADQKVFKEGYERLHKSFTDAVGRVGTPGPEFQQRFGAIVASRKPDIERIVRESR